MNYRQFIEEKGESSFKKEFKVDAVKDYQKRTDEFINNRKMELEALLKDIKAEIDAISIYDESKSAYVICDMYYMLKNEYSSIMRELDRRKYPMLIVLEQFNQNFKKLKSTCA